MPIDPASLLSSQKHRLIKLSVQTGSDHALLLDSFSGNEAISQPFSFDLALLSRDPLIELKTVLGQPTLLEIELANGAHRCIHGHITAFNHLNNDGGLSYYSATLS
ncbi:type VI secretion system tip protein VgrG, partial [Pseudomonas lactis]